MNEIARARLVLQRERIRRCQRTCSACGRVQSEAKLDEIETLDLEARWACETCGREHCIV